MFVVSDTQVRYLSPARLDDALIVTALPLEIGRASMTIQQQAFLKTSAQTTLLCEGTIRIGWINATTYKPTRIPNILLEALQ